MVDKLNVPGIEHQELSDSELESIVGGRGKNGDYRRTFSYSYTSNGSNSSGSSSLVVSNVSGTGIIVSSSNNNTNR